MKIHSVHLSWRQLLDKSYVQGHLGSVKVKITKKLQISVNFEFHNVLSLKQDILLNQTSHFGTFSQMQIWKVLNGLASLVLHSHFNPNLQVSVRQTSRVSVNSDLRGLFILKFKKVSKISTVNKELFFAELVMSHRCSAHICAKSAWRGKVNGHLRVRRICDAVRFERSTPRVRGHFVPIFTLIFATKFANQF